MTLLLADGTAIDLSVDPAGGYQAYVDHDGTRYLCHVTMTATAPPARTPAKVCWTP